MVYEAFQRKKFFLVLAGLCAALSLLGFVATGAIPTASTAQGTYPVAGWAIIVGCFGMAGVFACRALDTRPHLRIDRDGIRAGAHSDATVPWDQIVGVGIHPMRNTTIISFHLRNPEAYPPKNRFTRATAGMNSALGFGSMGVAASYLTGGPQGVLGAVRHFRPDLFPGA